MERIQPCFIDLFAGAGGLSTGLVLAGLDCLYANEVSPAYAQTLKSNHPGVMVDTKDLREVDAACVRSSLLLARGELDLLAGGPPCQGFSVNAPSRAKDDPRNHLFKDFLRFVAEFEPKAILIENVPGIFSLAKGETVRSILGALSDLGYDADVGIVYAAHHGVPQMRWRTIFVANRCGIDPKCMLPIPRFSVMGRANFGTTFRGKPLVLSQEKVSLYAKNEKVTVWDAIGDLPAIANGGGSWQADYPRKPQNEFQRECRDSSASLFNHQCARLGPSNIARLPHIPVGGSWRDIPVELLPRGMQGARRSDHTKRYGRLDPDGIGSTILTKCDPHWGTYIHPQQDRVISVREAARLQSFPDNIVFAGSITEQYEQVGNAVPPLLARAIGSRIREVLLDSMLKETDLQQSPWLEEQQELRLEAIAS